MKKSVYKRKWFIALFAFIILSALFGGEKEASPKKEEGLEVAEAELPEPRVNKEEARVEKEEEALKEDGISQEFRAALNKAQTYSDSMHMSKEGLFQQLISEYGENFPPEAANFAIDKIEVSWENNALKKAQTYARTMYMSREGVFDQLTSEYGEAFSQEEAQYAIDNLDTDWKENAFEKGKIYMETMDMSLEAIKDQLSSPYGEKFTHEEADYAVEKLRDL